MNRIFKFLDYTNLYNRCIMASIAHAIMVGKYNLLASEQSWDGTNYNFQNMEGVRVVISFDPKTFVCVIQNTTNHAPYREEHVAELFFQAEEKIIQLAENEALQYMLFNYKGDSVPFVSAVFWGTDSSIISNQSEEEIIKFSDKTIMPFLYSEEDAKKYWKNYYEMSDAQVKLMEDIYIKRISENGRIELTKNEKDKFLDWFDDISECIESFAELNIIF